MNVKNVKNIKNLNDKQLHQNLLSLKSEESHVVASIICHLEEVYRRRLFSAYQCSSLYDYCIRILGYSNGEAHRKVSACKLASHCSSVKESIARGELSLSNAASVQVFLNQSKKYFNKTPQSQNRSENLFTLASESTSSSVSTSMLSLPSDATSISTLTSTPTSTSVASSRKRSMRRGLSAERVGLFAMCEVPAWLVPSSSRFVRM